MCWLIPGVALIGGFTGAFMISYGGSGPEWLAFLLVLGLPIATAIGCGIFASFVWLSRTEGYENIKPGRVTALTIQFVLSQIIIAPGVAFFTAIGCSVISSSF